MGAVLWPVRAKHDLGLSGRPALPLGSKQGTGLMRAIALRPPSLFESKEGTRLRNEITHTAQIQANACIHQM